MFTQLKYLAPNGITFNPEEKMNVSLSLQQLQCELNFEELYLWGKVEGKSKHFQIVNFVS